MDPASGPGAPPAADAALRDDLTGAYNRRYLRELFETRWQGWLAERERIALLLIDLDLFKEVNDRFGHPVGDAVLREAVARLQEAFRTRDPLVRYGGDEFVLLLPGIDGQEARELAERARKAVVAAPWRHPESGRPLGVPVSFSVGVAVAPDDGADPDDVLAEADRRLYEDKRERHERRQVRRRRLQLLVGVVLLAVVALAGNAFLDSLRSTPPPPQVGFRPAAPLVTTIPSPEDEALRLEVDRLTQALADERRAHSERRDSAERIAELERLLHDAQTRLGRAAPPTAAASLPAAPAASDDATSAPHAAPPAAGTQPGQAPVAESPELPAGTRQQREAPAPAPLLVPPQLLRHEPAIYPYLARRQRMEGSVVLELDVDAQGRVTGIRQTSAELGYGLDEAARRAARSAQYRPATRDGVAVPGRASLTIRFLLGDGGG